MQTEMRRAKEYSFLSLKVLSTTRREIMQIISSPTKKALGSPEIQHKTQPRQSQATQHKGGLSPDSPSQMHHRTDRGHPRSSTNKEGHTTSQETLAGGTSEQVNQPVITNHSAQPDRNDTLQEGHQRVHSLDTECQARGRSSTDTRLLTQPTNVTESCGWRTGEWSDLA